MRCALKPSDPAGELPERTAQSLRALAGGPVSRLPQLLEAMVAVGSDHDLRRALDRIAETAASLTGARHAAVGIHDEDGGPGDLIAHGVSPEAEPPAGAELEVPIQVRGELFGTLYLAGKGDGEEFGEGDLHLVRVLATEAGIALSNARMHSAARQRRRWIDGAASVTTALLAGPETRSTATNALTVVAEQGRELAEAATGAVLLPHAEGGMEVVAISTVLPEAVRTETLRGRIPPESPVLHQLHAGLAVFSDDFAADPRSVSPLSRHYGPTMLLPLRSHGRVLGALALCRMSGDRRFSHPERTLATQFAAQAAVALVLVDRHRDRERLAVFEDRDRIARDLHDLVIQRLFATGMLLETARRKAVLPEVREGLGGAIDELDATIQEIRTAIIALQQGPSEAPPGLRTRVLRAAGAATAALGGRPSVQFIGPVDARVDDRGGRELMAALGEALAALEASAPPQPARVSVVVDATATLPDGRAGVRLTVSRPDGSHPPLTWERPLKGGSGS
ncbi:sensor histidine kinase [Streptomyces nigrescens]|uniref:GAF domain-containing protein n=1 Tax=Streptomyces nigrescens TaxID=1920 RepID=A0A640TSC2_STRNI|nr:GAF domain-containing protein [Streptomyces libani]WAU00661.1 GAF domain-containing protein [Streptomyces libani subsp. libani]GFE26517.1 histidine kinase [Streptomyces libani subsp. libani]GGW00730.1 histidine kinase [Streptomyces libani subsp. libani]